MAPAFRIDVQPLDDTTFVVLRGEADPATCEQLRTTLRRCEGDVSVDLSGTTLLDASNIGVLVSEHNRLAAANARLRLNAPAGTVRTVLHIVGLAPWIEPRELDAGSARTGVNPSAT